jgi:hypothetical protein
MQKQVNEIQEKMGNQLKKAETTKWTQKVYKHLMKSRKIQKVIYR